MLRIRMSASLVAVAVVGVVGCSEREAARPLPDAGLYDSGFDSGAVVDGGPVLDAGPMTDGGSVTDGGPMLDGGPRVDGGPTFDGGMLCPVATLGCTSGTVMGNTAYGATRVTDWSSCGASATDYTGAESAYTFATGSATAQGVTVVAHRISSADDYDLFVVAGDTTTCDGAGTCAGSSTDTTADETISFMAAPGENFAVYYDRYTAGPGTTTFSLTVTCATVSCGDGVVATGFEECDDGNTTAGDGCDASCALETGWSCAGAPSVCALDCGNAVIDPIEDCDDGNVVAGDGCSDTCVGESGFSCSGEPSVCVSLCGDGTRDLGEQCDDGNALAADGCAACVPEAGFGCVGEPSVCTAFSCGNGALQGGESCDDANVLVGDGCNAACKTETFTATAAPGASVVLTGNLAMSTTTFVRPYADCVSLATTPVHYQAFVIQNTTATAQTLTLTAAWGGDGYLFVYQPSFTPASPLDRCLAGDDDFGSTTASQISSFVLPAGEQRIVVATSYSDSAASLAPFTVTVATL